jgi:hypothetical protein
VRGGEEEVAQAAHGEQHSAGEMERRRGVLRYKGGICGA